MLGALRAPLALGERHGPKAHLIGQTAEGRCGHPAGIPSKLGDDGGRQRLCEFLDEVDGAGGGEAIDQPIGDFGDPLLERPDPLGREGVCDEQAELAMQRIVDVLEAEVPVLRGEGRSRPTGTR